ncbi:NAD(P)H-dependent flavin oxidoreductase [Methylobacterium nodulans]|uniref:2-nitropropane dioxygenase NPD n=1 Tax=Methylobacterium nodulans (strain LMG 21967 / CNCM I-2342 / ORS 2060) TaxID=460265 RepID=B8IV61_METNO|nr:nitronate monooxygenase family protein [Methylobacterium nodulans]ACL60912.1 2-nitropropane dioxygenase NPD [Methylobacterium nodulans ORS 2060]
MSLPDRLADALALPVVASPMFIVSGPDLVIAQCLGGIVGSFPALNARPKEALDDWLTRIDGALAAAMAAEPGRIVAPYAVNQIVHASNDRLEHDLAVCARHRVPIIITSLRAPDAVVSAVHGWGGLVFHDVTTVRHAEKALEAGVDGLILVCAGAGGHAGTLSPFALVGEVRRFYDGPLVLSGAITTGSAILAAQAMGADLAYMGTRFIATAEANAAPAYKDMIVATRAADVVYTPFFTGVSGNYLKPSVVAAGLDPDALPDSDKSRMDFGSGRTKAWRDIWGAGQGVGTIDDVLPAAEVIARLKREYAAAREALLSRAGNPCREILPTNPAE